MNDSGIYRSLIIKEIIPETSDFKTFIFEEGHHISYKAGQYLTLVHLANQEEIRRSYSIVSSPSLSEPLAIGVKRIPNGFFSRLLVDQVKPGDELRSTGAGGFFTWIPASPPGPSKVFLFAAGSGITPLFSILKTILTSTTDGQVVLLYSNSTLKNAIYYKELTTWKEKHPDRLFIEFLFSDTADLRKARLYRDSLMAWVQHYSQGRPVEALYYICGPVNYMRLCRFTLLEMGVPKERIKQEDFIIQKPAKGSNPPPDKRSHLVEINISGKSFSIQVNYPDTILAAARKHHISLPYSCEAGRCGNCVAKCISGKVWLSYNEVLTEKEIGEGLTLTCVGHPLDDVVLEI